MPQPRRLTLSSLDSAIGTMLLVTDEDDLLRALDWSDYAPRLHRLLERHYGPAGTGHVLRIGATPRALSEALDAYFDGELRALDSIPTATGGTEFQRRVWRGLRDIPPGATCSYGELASRLGCPTAVRAVGLANGANPIGIVVPCHRVIGANGKLTGYGGGLERKQWLLRHESGAGAP